MQLKTVAMILALIGALTLAACDYGQVGGADITTPATPEEVIALMDPLRGSWRARYGAYEMDGYRIGYAKDLEAEMGATLSADFPSFHLSDYTRVANGWIKDGYAINDYDYYLFYDDSSGGEWGFAYLGIVRGVNVFSPTAGAIIIEYPDGGCPRWLAAPEPEGFGITNLPFFGMYYRTISADVVRMANAVDLAAINSGAYYNHEPYWIETATLAAAQAKFTLDNDGEFINWGVVYPQTRER
jgi:hypothetical protein